MLYTDYKFDSNYNSWKSLSLKAIKVSISSLLMDHKLTNIHLDTCMGDPRRRDDVCSPPGLGIWGPRGDMGFTNVRSSPPEVMGEGI